MNPQELTSVRFRALTGLHPWWSGAWRHAVRSVDGVRKTAIVALVLLTVLVSAALATRAGMVRWLLDNRVIAGLAIAMMFYLLARPCVGQLASSLRYGWTATLPLDPAAGRRTLWHAITALALLVMLWLALGLLGVAIGAGTAAYLSVLGSLCIGVAAAGLALVWLGMRIWAHPPVVLAPPRMRVPLLSLAWLESPKLPHLVAWQHRQCTLQWRTGGGAKPVGVLIALLPGASSPMLAFILVTAVLLLAWLRCALLASLHVVDRAGPIVRLWPVPENQASYVLMRFPVAACVLTFVGLFAIALAIQPRMAAVWAALGVVLAAPTTLVRLVIRFRSLRR